MVIELLVLVLVYTDYSSSYDQLLAKDGSYRIHHRNLQRLAIEIYKFKNNIGPEILHGIFEESSNIYNTRSDKILNTRNVKSVLMVLKLYLTGLKKLGTSSLMTLKQPLH